MSLHRAMSDMGIDHDYAEYPGGHTWEYWDEHVREAIAFHRHAVTQAAAQQSHS